MAKRPNAPRQPMRQSKIATAKVVKSASPLGGAPHVEIDHDALFQAALTHASFDHLGVIFGVEGKVLQRPPHREIIDKARAEKKQHLLAAQFDTAIRDRNPTMQIWLGKQYLEQKDVQRTEHTGADGKPIQTEKTKKVVAYIPDNSRRRPEEIEE